MDNKMRSSLFQRIENVIKEKNSITFILVIPMVLFMIGCDAKNENNDLELLSPKQIVELYYKASDERDTDLLRKILYFPPGTSETEIEKKIGRSSLSGEDKAAAKRMMKMMGTAITVEYEKILDKNTAEVGVVAKVGIGPLAKRIPGDQIILKKDGDIWKIHYSRGDLTTEQLIETIRKNPETAWPYYYLGMKIWSENPYRAYKYYKRCYELESEGFWVDKYQEVIDYGDPQKMERLLLKNIQITPEKSDGQAVDYIRLCQLFTEYEDFEKARVYLDKAGTILKENSCGDSYIIEKLAKAKKELELRKSGQYHDILDEIEAKQSK